MADDGFIGLGYHNSTGLANAPSGPPSSESVADTLMKRYMHQCLEYHYQQESASGSRTEPSFGQAASRESAPTFVSPQETGGVPVKTDVQLKVDLGIHPSSGDGGAGRKQAADAVEAARAIAMKFRAQYDQRKKEQGTAAGGPVGVSPVAADATSFPPAVISVPLSDSTDHAEERRRYADMEVARRRRALLKNFEYVARKDEADMRAHADELERQKLYSRQVETQSQERLERRKEAILEAELRRKEKNSDAARHQMATSQSGVGTSSRRKIEQKKKREGHVAMRDGRRDLGSAVYMTGLPTNGSIKEEDVRRLFACYGAIRKVTLYTEKLTGRLKGDGLVVYDTPLGPKKERIAAGEVVVAAVCSQVRFWNKRRSGGSLSL